MTITTFGYTPGGTHGTIGATVMFRALEHVYRQSILEQLSRTSETSIQELCRHILTVTNAPTSEHHICLSLYHHHLPALQDLALIDYDDRSGMVSLLIDSEMLKPYLDLLE